MTEFFGENEEFMKFIENLDNTDEWVRNSTTYPRLGHEGILFVGSTKYGKSTFINCLLNYPLISKFDESTEEWILENKESGSGFLKAVPKIKEAGESETLWPNLYTHEDNINLWDMPGLNDNRANRTELQQAAMARIVITKNMAISFVLVIGLEQVRESNPMQLVELINLLLKYSPNIAQHLFVVISKSKIDNWKNLLKTFLAWTPSKKNENILKINRAQNVIRQVIENNAGYSFKMPKFDTTNEKKVFKFPDDDLIKIIDKIEKIRIYECPYVIKQENFINMHDTVKSISIKNFQKLTDLCGFFEYECVNSMKANIGKTKEERIQYLKNFRNILPMEGVETSDFLYFVSNNTSSCRNREYYKMIKDLKRYDEFIKKCVIIFDNNFNSTKFELEIFNVILKVKEIVDRTCENISLEVESSCNVS